MDDMVRKGRTLYAEQRSNNKIPSYKRAEIVNKYLSGTRQTDLAKEYNCHTSAIWNAIHTILPVKKDHGLKGENHPRSKLKEKDIYDIREYRNQGLLNKDIAEKYGVTKELIQKIVTKQLWKHI